VSYLFRRLLQAVVVLFLVTVVTFALMHLAPGDPFSANPELRADQEAVQRWLQQRQLDLPLPVQYLAWLRSIGRGEWGESLLYNRPVGDLIREKLPATLMLTVTSFVIALALAVPLGTLAALRAGSLLDRILSFLALGGLSLPSFWLGMVAIMLFSYHLQWFPATGVRLPAEQGALTLLCHLLMPVMVLTIGIFCHYVRYVRQAVREVLHQDFVRTARAKGLTSQQVLYRHVLPNAAVPLITIAALSLPYLFTGAAVVEHVFSWPGMGRFIIAVTLGRDYPAIMAVNLLVAALVALANLAADLLYALLDPRVRFSR
jgi:peptide/nickel transport system permease protein